MSRYRSSRSTAAIGIAAALVLSLGACGGDDTATDTADDPSPTADAPDTTAEASPDGDGTATGNDLDDAFLIDVLVYFHLDDELAPTPVRRQIDAMTTGTIDGLFEAWLAGPTPEELAAGYSTAVPDGTRLLGVVFENDVMTVDLSAEFESGGGSAAVLGRLAELVMTATTGVIVLEGVELLIEGEPVTTFSAEGVVIDGLLTLDDVDGQLPVIAQHRVLPGDEVAAGAQMAGWARVPEGRITLQVVDGSGVVASEWTTEVGCETDPGCRGPYVTFLNAGDLTGPATLRLFHLVDGDERDVVEIPITVAS